MRIVRCLTMSAFVLVASAVWSQDSANVIYKNPKATIPERVRDLLSRMTMEEKVAQLQSQWSLPSIGGDSTFMVAPVLFEKGHLSERAAQATLGKGLGTYAFLDEFIGMSPGGPREGAERRNLIQNWVLQNTRLGIPILFHGEALHGAVTKGATLFPQAVGLGSTWDPDLLKEMFTTVAQEARASGNALVLAPVLDLSRDPRYGRVEEMYSEDPYLVGQLGVAAVLGLQGDKFQLDPEHVFATAKHFVHGQPENGTNVGPNDFSERTMRQVFLYPFQQVVEKAHIAAVMPSYNENNGGVPSHANPWLLKEVLRKEWGFTGITVSDYMAVEQLNSLQHVASNNAAAGALALNSGVDMELPTPAGYPDLAAAVKAGKVTAKDLDAAVARVLTIKFRAGLFDHPLVDPDKAAELVGNRKHGELARKVADEAIILLQNKGNVLPLDAAKIKTLAVIGPNANKKRQGTYSGIPPYFVTVLDGIRQRVGSGTKVVYAEGCRISEPDAAPNFNVMMPYKAPKEDEDRKLIKEAVDVAGSADVVVLVLGGNEVVSRESIGQTLPGATPAYGDSDTLELPGRQNELVREVSKLGKPMVAFLLNGNPKRVYRLMREDNLLCVRKRKFVVTTDSNHGRKVYPNLAASMVLTGVDQLWRADITYVRLREEFVFLAVILDAFSRRVIGWALDRNMEDELTLTALRMALSRRNIQPGLVHHSDRGSQYASNDYTDLLKAHGIDISMSRKGNPWDNAACESFMKTLKYEEVLRNEYRDLAEARASIPQFLERVYNQKRLHSALGYLSPVEFEAQLKAKNMEAAARPACGMSFQGIGNLSIRC